MYALIFMCKESLEDGSKQELLDSIFSGRYPYSYCFGRLTEKGAQEMIRILGDHLYHYTFIEEGSIEGPLLPAIALPPLHPSKVKYTLLEIVEEWKGPLIAGAYEVVWLSQIVEDELFNSPRTKPPIKIELNDSSDIILNKFVRYIGIVGVWREHLKSLVEHPEELEQAVELIRRFALSKYNRCRKPHFYQILTDNVIKPGIPVTLAIRSPAIIAVPYVDPEFMQPIFPGDVRKEVISSVRKCAVGRTVYNQGDDMEKFKRVRIKENLEKLRWILDGLVEISCNVTVGQVRERFFDLSELAGVSPQTPFVSLLGDPYTRKELERFCSSCV